MGGAIAVRSELESKEDLANEFEPDPEGNAFLNVYNNSIMYL